MGLLLAANALLFLILHVIWSKGDLLNVTLKIIFLVLTLVNGFQSYQVFEVARIEAKKSGS